MGKEEICRVLGVSRWRVRRGDVELAWLYNAPQSPTKRPFSDCEMLAC
jgi:hypothetical protein